MYRCICVCIYYTYICIYIYIYIHITYKHTYIHIGPPLAEPRPVGFGFAPLRRPIVRW